MSRTLEAVIDEGGMVCLSEAVISWGRGLPSSAPAAPELALFEAET